MPAASQSAREKVLPRIGHRVRKVDWPEIGTRLKLAARGKTRISRANAQPQEAEQAISSRHRKHRLRLVVSRIENEHAETVEIRRVQGPPAVMAEQGKLAARVD